VRAPQQVIEQVTDEMSILDAQLSMIEADRADGSDEA
jgi:hypothetical protein